MGMNDTVTSSRELVIGFPTSTTGKLFNVKLSDYKSGLTEASIRSAMHAVTVDDLGNAMSMFVDSTGATLPQVSTSHTADGATAYTEDATTRNLDISY